MSTALILTCEHGGNHVPRRLRHLFAEEPGILETHRGWDPGALELARHLSSKLNIPLHEATISRLVIEMNRSPNSRNLFSRFVSHLPEEEKRALQAEYYDPFRAQVLQAIESLVKSGPVVHVSVHSFTPVLDGEERNAEIGLLYDPGRKRERAFCEQWKREIELRADWLRVKRNYPYLGTSDGHTRALRRAFPDARYAGIELEVNQRLVGDPRWKELKSVMAASLDAMVT
jgi:predicted N-formylglutamate amidohydrolase